MPAAFEVSISLKNFYLHNLFLLVVNQIFYSTLNGCSIEPLKAHYIWRIGKFAHKIFSQNQKTSTKIFVSIFNIKISEFIIFQDNWY